MTADGVRFPLDDVHLVCAGGVFTGCTFHQASRAVAAGQFGVVDSRSLFRGCSFVGVDFNLHRFWVGHARFEDCTFDRCRMGHFYSVRADFVGCRFRGRLTDVTLVGADAVSGIPNDIRHNDFREARIDRVAFQSGARPADQRWPEGTVIVGDESDFEMVATTTQPER